MSALCPLCLDDALKIADAFASAASCPIRDKTLPNGEISPNCFSGRQLAGFLRGDEAGCMKASPIEHIFSCLMRRPILHCSTYVLRRSQSCIHSKSIFEFHFAPLNRSPAILLYRIALALTLCFSGVL
jgi:hypothetical protein